MNPLDSLVAVLSPQWALRRETARFKLDLLKRRYDAASHSKRTQGWRASNRSPREATLADLATLRARSRNLTENNEWAAEALRSWTRNAIGTGTRLHVRGGAEAERDTARELWRDHMLLSTKVDPARQLNFGGIERVVMREVVEAGECLIRRRWRQSSSTLDVPFQLQVIEADHLDTHKRLETDSSRVVQGVQYSKRGSIQGYWLFTEHPGDSMGFLGESIFVPARDVIHVFDIWRAGQVRGVPWGACVMLKLRDFDLFEDATLQRALVARMLVGFVRDIAMDDSGTQESDIDVSELELTPGGFEELPGGKTVEFSDPPDPVGVEEFSTVSLRGISKGYGVPYEELTGDMSKVSYASGRLGRLPFACAIREFQQLVWFPRVSRRVWEWFQDATVDVAGLMPRRLRADFTAQPPYLADPVTELKAANMRVRGGYTSLSEEIRSMGRDPQEVWEELSEDYERLDELGLVLDTDGRQVTAAGAPVGDAGGGAPDEGPDQESEEEIAA